MAGCPSAVRVPGTGATTEPSVLTGIPQIIVSFVGGAGLGLGTGTGEGTAGDGEGLLGGGSGEGEGPGLGDGEGDAGGGDGDGDGDADALGMLHCPVSSAPACREVPPGQR